MVLDAYSHVPWAGILLFTAAACTDEIMQLPKMLLFVLCLATTMHMAIISPVRLAHPCKN